MLTIRVSDNDGGYEEETEETFEYKDINDLLEDILVANETLECQRY